MPASSITSQPPPHPNNHAQPSLPGLSHTDPRVTIFDIPLIVDEIFCHLSIYDFRNCQRVSKHWRDLCRPWVWRLVSLHGQITSDTQRESILQNSRWIRSLSVDFWDTRLVDGEPCRGLHELTIWGQQQQQQPAQQEEGGEVEVPDTMPSTQSATSWDLIGKNSALRSLSLEYTELLLPQLTTSRFNSILLSTLRVLTIDIGIRISSPLPIITLLCHCPDTLQKLSLTNTGGNFWKPPINVVCPASASTLTARWRVLPSLRSLRVECQMVENLNAAILLPMLQHCCPRLRQLALGLVPQHLCWSLVDILVVSCPFLNDLEIPEVELHDLEMFRLVQGYVGLQRVNIAIYQNMVDRVIPTLIQSSGSTLTRVRIVERSAEHGLSNTMPLYPTLFLEHCPRLVSLVVRPVSWYLGLESSLRSMVEGNNGSKVKDGSQWACFGLETLALSCLVPIDSTNMSRKRAIVELTERLCRKLKDQKRLRTIRLDRATRVLQLPIGNTDKDDANLLQAIMERREKMIREYLYFHMAL
ncbi:hypothetical protein BG015_003256 [Linnemannia schmuckeri]|uniref:F-box domain-containing protein n=1 Tax=Linnemannia schmuckeri TaxID=64567 RepID=A0A9P5VCW6_9FUNG|nr:hypothetical protein BG015_003256 [Linnemannia schmuckeri]